MLVAPVPEERALGGVTFEAFALEYVERLVKPNPETKRKYLERLRVHVFPVIGERPIVKITRREMLDELNRVADFLAAQKLIENRPSLAGLVTADAGR